MSRLSALLASADALARWLEDAVLVVLLTAMIVLASGQILLRNAFDIAFIWTDELLRLMVLWIALAGAVAASRADRHINVAVLDRFVSGRLAFAMRAVIHAFTAAVCALVAWVSLEFVHTSREYGDVLLGSVPAWWLQAILPLGFALIAWRYALFLAGDLAGLVRRQASP